MNESDSLPVVPVGEVQQDNTKSATGPTVALVLGSGGARGYAHTGVIEVLLERGYRIIAVSGCSVGAMVGGVYAAGKLHEFKDWATGLGQFDVFRLLDISLSSPGAIRGDRVFSVVREMIGDTLIEDLPIPFTAVATDLLGHKEVWFQEGSLHQAIRASVAIPSLLTPVIHNGRMLVDGGLLNPLPIIPTISAHADLIIAVSLSGEDGPGMRSASGCGAGSGRVSPPKSIVVTPAMVSPATDSLAVDTKDAVDREDEWLDRLRQKASRFLDKEAWRSLAGGLATESAGNGSAREKVADARITTSLHDAGLGMFDIMNLSFETMQSALTQYKLAGYPPDILINVSKHACKTFDYHKAPELILLGRALATEMLDRLEPAGADVSR